MKNTKKKVVKLNQSRLSMFALVMIIVAVTLIINLTVAWFAFSNKGDAELSLGYVKLDTNIVMTEDLTNVVPNKPIITAASFTKTEGATDCFVRAKFEYYSNATDLTREEKNYIVLLNGHDISDKITTGVDGVNWVPSTDGYLYLLDNDGEFVKVADGDSYKFLKDGEVIKFPVLLGTWLYPSYDFTLSDLHINLEFQAVQSSYLPSEEFDEIVNIFELCFPDDRKFDEVVVKFDSMGGNRVEAKIVKVGDKLTAPSDPIREDYTFDGWYVDSEATTAFDFNSEIDRTTVLYAKWIENAIVTYNTLGGNSIKASSVAPGSSIEAPEAPTRVGYTFDKWYLKDGSVSGDWGSEVTFPLEVSEDITIYAKWIKNVELQFETFDGSSVTTVSVAPGSTVLAPTSPTREGYSFVGWYSEDGSTTGEWGSEIVFPLTLSATTKIYAKWEKVGTRSFTDGLLFSENKLVAYIGTDTDVVVPASYAKTGKRNENTISITNDGELYGALSQIQAGMTGADIFPVIITTQARSTTVYNNAAELEAFDPMEFTYPFTISYEYEEYVDGNDYTVTELGDMSLGCMAAYAAMMGMDFEPVLLTSVSLPNTLRKLGMSVFVYQTKLESIVIPEGVTEIGSLDSMYGTMSVVLPSTLTSVSEEFGAEGVTEYINLSNLTREDLNLSEDENIVTSIAESKVYKYVDGDDTFYFYVDGANTRLGLINGSGTITTPNSGVTLKNIHDETRTTTLGEYGFIEFNNCITYFDEVIIAGGAKVIDCAPFVYANSIKSLTINTPLDSWDGQMVGLLFGLEVLTINEVVDEVGDDVLASDSDSLKFVLCASDEIAKPFTGKGLADENIYVLQIEGYEDVTFAETETSGVSSGTDAEGKVWVRTGEDGDYVYYRRYEKGKSFSDGLLFVDNKVVGYIGYEKDVVIPTTYSKSGQRLTRTIECEDVSEMMVSFYEIYMPLSMGYDFFPITFTDSNKTLVIHNVDEMDLFEPNGFTYPLTLSYEYEEFIDGSDYTVTEIGQMGLVNYGIVLGVEQGVFPESYIETITIPNSITTIGENAFAFQAKLINLEIPESVTTIGDGAFESCMNLTSLVLPASLQTACNLEYMIEIPTEIIYLGNTFTAEDFGLTSFLTSKDSSQIYTYKDGKNTFYFHVDAEVELWGIRSTGSVTTPEAGITLTNLYNRTKATTLTQYSIPIGKLAMLMCQELTIAGGVTDMASNAFIYAINCNRITIDKPLEMIGDSAFVGSSSLEAVIVNYPIDRLGSDLFELSLKARVLCATDEIAESFKETGFSYSRIFIKQTTGYESLTFGDVTKAGLAYATDNNGVEWIRDVQNGLYVYYKQYEIERNFTQGLIFDEGRVIGYIGDAKKVEIPTSYTATGNKEIISKSVDNINELASIMFKIISVAGNNESQIYPITITSIQNQMVYENVDDLGSCLEDLTTFSFPALVTYEIPEFVDGNDNIVTEIAPNAFALGGGYWSVLSGYPIYNLIEEIVIPEGVTTIGTSAFSGNVQLHKLNIPSTVNQLGATVFTGGYALPSIVLPQGLTTLDANAFENSNIKEIINLSSIPNVNIDLSQADMLSGYIINSIADSRIYTYTQGNNIFYFHVFNGEFTLISIIGEANEVITPSAGVTLVGLYDTSKTVTLGNYAIGEQKCGYLPIENLILSDSVTAVDNHAFRESPYLKSVTLGRNIKTIGEDIFYYDKNLKVVYVKCDPTTIANQIFNDCDKLEYVIFDSEEVATKFMGKGVGLDVMFIKQSEVDNTLTFSETATAGISSAVDGEDLNWIRLGQEGDYTYYKQYVLVTNLTKGLILQENKIIGYLGDSQKVEVPTTYAFTGTRKLITEHANDQVALTSKVYDMLYPIQFEYDCYPFTITSAQVTDEFLTSAQLMNNFDPSKYSYPATITYYVNEYMEGEDYTITEIGPAGLANISKLMVDSNKMGNYDSGIREVVIPEGVTSLGQIALAYQNLVKVALPSTLTSIGESAFTYATLGSVVIPSTVNSIGANVFEGSTIFELINLSGIEIDTSTATVLHTLTSTAESKVYSYAGNGYTLYFINEDDGLVLYGAVNESCTNLVLPNNGVTLTNIYDPSKTITLNNYKIYDKAFEGDILIESLVIGDNCLEIGANAFKYCTNLEIVTILADELEIKVGLFDCDTKLNYILTKNWDVARRISTFADVYVEETSGYNNLTFVEQVVPGGNVFTATDTNSKKWVRTGDIGSGYAYYKEYEINTNVLEGYKVDAEGTLVGYEGSDINLEIPDTYSVAYYKYDGLYDGSFTGSLPIEFDTPNGKVLVTTGEHLLAFVLQNLNTIETFTMRCSILIAIEGDDHEFIKVQDEAFPAGVVSIALPSGIKELESQPFENCDDTLKMLTIPSSLETFESFTFSWLSALTYALCEDDNVATLVNSNINADKLFVKQVADGDGVTYTDEAIGNITIATGTDSNSKKWVRTGSAQGGYTYYMQYATGKTLTIMDENGSNVFEKIKVVDGEVSQMPSREYAVDSEGTSTKMIEGWYTDSAYTTKFEFGSELAANTTLYPKIVNVSSGLEFVEASDGLPGLRYRVGRGTCTDTVVVIPESYMGYPVTEIKDGGFTNYVDMTDIILPNTIERIRMDGFYGCDGLTTPVLPESIISLGSQAFKNCDNLALTSLPSGITSIGSDTFYGCSNLALTALPSGLTSIPNYAFGYCSNLAISELPSGVKTIGINAFERCKNITLTSLPSGITSIPNYAFDGCEKLDLKSWPENLTSVGQYAFRSCYKLNPGSLPAKLTKIENYSFSSCSMLNFSSIPSAVTIIGQYAFSGCSGLTSLTELPSGLTTLGSYSFKDCRYLNLTSLPSGIKTISDGVFSNCQNITLSSGLPSGITSIGASAFQSCYKLTWTTIPSTVTSIGNSAFSYCKGLITFEIPSGVTSIGQYAFRNCTELQVIKVPATVSSVMSNMFYQSNKLNYILCENSTVATSVSGKGRADTFIYIKQASDASGVAYTNTTIGSMTIGVTSTPDASGYNWVRTGTTGDYAYYKCKATAS